MSQPELKVVDTPARVTIAAVPVGLLTVVWPQCIKLLQKVVDRSGRDLTLNGIHRRLMSGDNMLLVMSQEGVIIAACVLGTHNNDSGDKILFIQGLAGHSIELWSDLYMSALMGISKDLGCTEVRASSVRRGWIRKIAELGYNFEKMHEIIGISVS